MKLLFNKNDNGADELAEITGTYYANNDYRRIKNDILLQSELIVELIGEEVYKLATDHYHGEVPPEQSEAPDVEMSLDELVHHIQLPIAYLAVLEFNKSNIVGHEDTGRKVKLDNENEKLPWEWMLDRDDEAHITKANRAVDRLIKFLDKHAPAEWRDSPAQKATKELFISNAKDFSRIYDIEESGQFYHRTKSLINEVQRTKIRPVLGKELFDLLLVYHRALNKENFENNSETDLQTLLAFVQTAVPMVTMSLAVERLPLRFLPYGIVQEMRSMMQSRNATQPALDETIRRFRVRFDRAANRSLDELKQFLAAQVDYDDFPLLPENPDEQKFFRT